MTTATEIIQVSPASIALSNPNHGPDGKFSGGTGGGVSEGPDRDVQYDSGTTPAKAEKAAKALGIRGGVKAAVAATIPDHDLFPTVHVGTSTDGSLTIEGFSKTSGSVWQRVIKKDSATGEPYVYNKWSNIEKSQRGNDRALNAFDDQVKGCEAAGINEMRCSAAGQKDDPSERAGYYAWARYGYDGPIPPEAHLPPQFASAKNVSELMKTPEGRKAWQDHGTTFNATFDTRPGSPSRRVLDAYVKERGAR